jgi:hypothetical protein
MDFVILYFKFDMDSADYVQGTENIVEDIGQTMETMLVLLMDKSHAEVDLCLESDLPNFRL